MRLVEHRSIAISPVCCVPIPRAVQSLRFFDNKNDSFEPIKLEGAVSDPTNYDASRHGLLTAVIQYKT
jgi:hypothetical protein